MKILIVDDEVVALKALKKRVDWVKYGFGEVFTASSSAEAREIISKNAVDVILCDIEMPGESGLDLVGEIKKNSPGIDVVMITCHAKFDYIKKAMKSGAKDYILKPIDYDELGNILSSIQTEREKKETLDKIGKLAMKRKSADENVFDDKSNEQRIRVVKDYIEENIQEKISVKDIAEKVHVNEQYLMRIFKKEQGQSINDYLTERRVIIASHMLKDTDYSINFIADCVGCDNYSYFTKLFKKQTGFTPREYRGQFK